MTPTKGRARGVFFLLLLIGPTSILAAQMDTFVDPAKTAQARSEEEFDHYLEIVSSSDAPQVIAKVDAFAAQFPQSELLGAAYRYQMHAWEKLNDFNGMLAAGRKMLLQNPDDIDTLLTLAPAMASRASSRPDREQLLSQAEQDATHALAEIATERISRKVSREQWNIEKRQMESEAHGALGIVALQKKQTAAAVHEFKTAIDLAPQPQGILFLRLGLALSSTAKDEARDSLRRAEELGPDPVRKSAAAELRRLSQGTPLR
jgi:tetratricopeptide (TPR) repeat protein